MASLYRNHNFLITTMTQSSSGMQAAFYLPIIAWLKTYRREQFQADIFAGAITAILLVPQGIAYAILAGLPPTVGLYASILPPVVYAVLGTSRTLSVGPVSIAAIMIASALNTPEVKALNQPMVSSLILAAESGGIMVLMALLRMGSLVNFISHPVLTGFTSGAAILIILSQIPHITANNHFECGLEVHCYQTYFQGIKPVTFLLSAAALSLLLIFGKPLSFLLKKAKLSPTAITAISKCGPLLTVVAGTLLVNTWQLGTEYGIAVVGTVPAGLPKIQTEFIYFPAWRVLLPSATFIALIAYVESVAIAKVTANLRGEKIFPNQELIALGSANLASAVSGGMPVAGGFSRTMVNFTAGARTQMAMLIAAGLLSLAVLFFTPWFASIPKAVLAAIILVAVTPLVRLNNIVHTWRYDRGDGLAEAITLLGVLALGIEEGILLGIILTIVRHLSKASRPHIAVVGRIPQTEHFRNIKRHQVETWEHLLFIRIDENITFANINYIEDYLLNELKRQPRAQHIVLIFTSVSDIDSTALEVLENLNRSLQAEGKILHLSEAKGPVLDKLAKTPFLTALHPGKVFFRNIDALKELVGLVTGEHTSKVVIK